MGMGEVGKANVCHASPAPADDNGRAVQQQPVDQIRPQESRRRFRSAFDHQMIDAGQRGNVFRSGNAIPTCRRGKAAEQKTPGRSTLKTRKSHVQTGGVRPQGAAAHQYRVMAGSFHMGMGARGVPGYPAAGPVGKGDAAVKRQPQFQRDRGPTERLAKHKSPHGRRSLLRHQAHFHCDAMRTQMRRTLTIGAGVWIAQGNHGAGYSSARHQVSAARSTRGQMETGFQRHIGGCPVRAVQRLVQRLRFGMGPSALLRPAAPGDDAVPDDQAADVGIGRGKAATAFRQRDGGLHEAAIVGGINAHG